MLKEKKKKEITAIRKYPRPKDKTPQELRRNIVSVNFCYTIKYYYSREKKIRTNKNNKPKRNTENIGPWARNVNKT